MSAVSSVITYQPILHTIEPLGFEEKVQFFMKSIHAALLSDAKKMYGDVFSCSKGSPLSPTIAGATVLKETNERKLMGLAILFKEQLVRVQSAFFNIALQSRGIYRT